MKRAMRTSGSAIATMDAAFVKVNQFRFVRLAFGVVAPAAIQWTTFEKYRRSNSWAIMERKTHEVEDKARRRRPGLYGGMVLRDGLL